MTRSAEVLLAAVTGGRRAAASDAVRQAAGPLARTTVAEWVWPVWSVQPILTLSPGWCCPSADWSAAGDETLWPSTETITSPWP